MSQLRTLQSASSLRDVANLLHIRPANLSYILYHLRPETKYSTFTIPKRNGGTRIIMAPAEPLKIVQKRLSVLLQDCLDENQTRKDNDRIAHGFKRRRSIITNAKQHRHRRYVFNVDLSDFFPSINFGRVRGYFIHDSHFSLQNRNSDCIPVRGWSWTSSSPTVLLQDCLDENQTRKDNDRIAHGFKRRRSITRQRNQRKAAPAPPVCLQR